MNNNIVNHSTEGQTKAPRIYTKLKFIRSEITGGIISFVSTNPESGRIMGVRQESELPKKICIADKLLAPSIILNALYNCTLIPMKDKEGYVVIEAEPTQFKASVTTTYVKNTIYLVEVKFGNKKIRFDPFDGRKESIKDFAACRAVLEKRVDVKNITKVVEDFEHAAKSILRHLERDKYSLHHKL